MADQNISPKELRRLDSPWTHRFIVPVKRIHHGDNVSFFLSSRAYSDIMTFIFQLNASMFPRKIHNNESNTKTVKAWTLEDPDVALPATVQNLANLVKALDAIIEEAPPDTGPRRFGNVSFRKWYALVTERASTLLDQYLPDEILTLGAHEGAVSAKAELEAYLLGSFGSSQRLDYGTGHELSFLAFLGCLWKLGAFPKSEAGEQERAIVLGVIEPYLNLIRRLILTYTLEPAGSHGVWGLDDHSFLPYIFGSAQLSPAISSTSEIVTEGSLPNAPDPGGVAMANVVERERRRNMYFSAIGFIYDVKKGPFYEHSSILYDISGVKAGWAKINKGMLKMYNAEVLGKFPVVQHFPFGSLFTWERDPTAATVAASVHAASQPSKTPPSSTGQQPLQNPIADTQQGGTRAPWAVGTPAKQTHPTSFGPSQSRIPSGAPPPPPRQMPLWNPTADTEQASTRAPWGTGRSSVPSQSRLPPGAPPVSVPSGPNQPTRAPWASSTPLPPPSRTTAAPRGTAQEPSGADAPVPSTRAPWADQK